MYAPIHSSSNHSFIDDLQHAINGEYSAIQCYSQLATFARNEEEQQQILEIRQDEIKHYRQFVQIYIQMTGMEPCPQIIESCPSDYLKGLEFSLKDEQETVDFYLDIADRCENPNIKEVFQRAAADEQNHAVWFLYFFTKQMM
ncbi:ferritin-like domain-containing protein [Gracilibacillus sp. YIM 98692]|uniref:ferritin-like domain-containing protein n=1 Tax=Gracilibacillus sp. YIM 98692 TaxID=2663532 RepID=UPI0013D0C00F|nr:ferritin-like domain-containing protein [Gracilibacillus sp. YIM 98692]